MGKGNFSDDFKMDAVVAYLCQGRPGQALQNQNQNPNRSSR